MSAATLAVLLAVSSISLDVPQDAFGARLVLRLADAGHTLSPSDTPDLSVGRLPNGYWYALQPHRRIEVVDPSLQVAELALFQRLEISLKKVHPAQTSRRRVLHLRLHGPGVRALRGQLALSVMQAGFQFGPSSVGTRLCVRQTTQPKGLRLGAGTKCSTYPVFVPAGHNLTLGIRKAVLGASIDADARAPTALPPKPQANVDPGVSTSTSTSTSSARPAVASEVAIPAAPTAALNPASNAEPNEPQPGASVTESPSPPLKSPATRSSNTALPTQTGEWALRASGTGLAGRSTEVPVGASIGIEFLKASWGLRLDTAVFSASQGVLSATEWAVGLGATMNRQVARRIHVQAGLRLGALLHDYSLDGSGLRADVLLDAPLTGQVALLGPLSAEVSIIPGTAFRDRRHERGGEVLWTANAWRLSMTVGLHLVVFP